MSPQKPWMHNFKPCGMREAIARVWYMTPSEVKKAFIHKETERSKSSSLYHALRMRIAEPDEWDKIVKFLKLRRKNAPQDS